MTNAAQRIWKTGGNAFTDAREPARTSMNQEERARRLGPALATAAYLDRCSALTALWKCRMDIARCAMWSGSWRVTVDRVAQVPGFGGTGFAAKELALDVMHGPLLQLAKDCILERSLVLFDHWLCVGHRIQ